MSAAPFDRPAQRRALRLYDTLSRSVRPFTPLDGEHVRMYVCGLTPSAEAHLGHARSFLFFDVLRRYLLHPRNGYTVTYVRNVTDIDDRSIATGRQEGVPYSAIVARHFAAFARSMEHLGVELPDAEPRATAYIPQIVAMVEKLIASGHAYATSDGVYYRVASFPAYGKLSGKATDELLVGARIAENEAKDDALDFALWKFRREPDEPAWPSPWGEGRPGWHIECSAMSDALLGVPFDIHGGGYDLVFPHHENEIAQSEPLMEAPPMARFWLHGGLLNFEGRKMSKSLGNFEPLAQLLERVDPLAIRVLFAQTGYRKPMNFTEESVAGATTALRRLQRAVAQTRALPERSEVPDAFFAALDEDMDTSRAIAVLFEVGRAKDASPLAAVREMAALLGIGPAFSDAALEAALAEEPSGGEIDAEVVARLREAVGDVVHANGASPEAYVDAVVARRSEAKAARDFALADRLRTALADAGIKLVDTKEGTRWSAGAA